MGRNRGGNKKQACTGTRWCACRKCEAKPSFGDGEVGGSRSFTPPVHATTDEGTEVTVAFGQGKHEGETLIAREHIEEMRDFYGPQDDKKHDHFGPATVRRVRLAREAAPNLAAGRSRLFALRIQPTSAVYY